MKKKIVAAFCLAAVLTAGGCSGAGTASRSESNGSQAQASSGSEASSSSAVSGTNSAENAASSSSSAADASSSRDIFAMDTYMTVTAYGPNAEMAVDQAQQEIERLDALLSTGAETSEVAQINANGGGTLSEDTTYLLERSLDLYDSTKGVFDIAIYPIMDAWGFTTGNYTVPSDEMIENLLPLTDANNIIYDKDESSISFAKDGMKIDFGGIAKGYTSGRIADIYRECGVTSGLINLGGNVQVVGTKTDGSKWRVAVQSPETEDDYLGILSTADRAVITSGGYERYFEQDGVKYHHIIDPSTGHPANNGLVSVTIVSSDGTLADGLSTSLFIMGKDKAAEYWRAHSDEFDTILEDADGVLYVTEGIADDFTSDHETNIIRKDGDT